MRSGRDIFRSRDDGTADSPLKRVGAGPRVCRRCSPAQARYGLIIAPPVYSYWAYL